MIARRLGAADGRSSCFQRRVAYLRWCQWQEALIQGEDTERYARAEESKPKLKVAPQVGLMDPPAPWNALSAPGVSTSITSLQLDSGQQLLLQTVKWILEGTLHGPTLSSINPSPSIITPSPQQPAKMLKMLRRHLQDSYIMAPLLGVSRCPLLL